MRVVIQRVKEAEVVVSGELISHVDHGLLVLLGVSSEDDYEDVDLLVDKIVNLRIFEDQEGKLNHSLLDVKGEMLVVSQFTLLAACKKGRRPSFTAAAAPEQANDLYQRFIAGVRSRGLRVETGRFQASMDVRLINYGPVTILLDTRKDL
ncbi:MAG TPA: D-aminoacyl-tRNA deacylase [Thermodesulfobacteriota bacterium]|nr:D-tyrosyl-tRNA(Tyr) deacylase [Deltaproteobacteria bacterium]HNR13061.1 D-aminoacyl-tRNA deacylase [Thermodesulfobacteriota bacterium]HNU70508.1 D-aminoacyl-tRNA deacylase [Thermodesulfobacteriota bacterium]